MRTTTRLESKALIELAQRQNMALSMFRPLEHQEPFFRNWARQHLLRGGNRSNWRGTSFSRVDNDTVTIVRADELVIGDKVLASDGASLVITPVESITYFQSEAYELVLSCGRTLIATPDHPVMTPDGWRCMTELTVGDRVQTVEGLSEVVSCELLNGLHEIVGIGTATETYISNGILSHNSGKSTCAAVMFAGSALDWDITMADGTKVPMRQPWQKNRPLRMWVIGFDLKHIGQTIHRLLFQPGLFKIIKDEQTGMYRAYKPWVPEDAARESEAKQSPPLIPTRYVEPGSWDWENKKGREFKSVKIRDPLSGHRIAEIYAFSSKADPKAGDPVDFIWIDEAIENAEHFKEWRARLFDLRGSLIWSSWPAVNNDALAELTEEAIKEAKLVAQGEKKAPLVRETVITLSANKALSQEVREEALGMFTSEEERRARDRGEYVTDLLRMYPLFDEYIHQAVVDGDPDEVSRILRATGGTPPSDWTVELVLDPGTAHPGVLFCAIPPHKIGRGRSFVIWDELSPDRHDATQLAKLVAAKLGGRRANRFIIDWQAGRRKAEGFEITIGDNYKKAFKKAGILLDDGELNWTIGSNNVGGRIGILQEHMHIEPNGLPKLRIVRSRCEKLCAQLTKYKKSCVNNDVKDDKPASGQTIDLAICAEYWFSSNPQYVIPRHGIAKKTVADDWAEFLEIRKKANKPKRVTYSIGPSYAVNPTPKVEL